MLKAHLDAIEGELLARSQLAANSGHPIHKGTPRESFISDFLEKHLGVNASIGTGEIIDARSRPREPRNQHDIVIYRPEFPKLQYGAGICAFLAESVIATIEVKSHLTKEDFLASVKTAQSVKKLERSLVKSVITGYRPPSILNYVVSYDGPATIQTVFGWKSEVMAILGITEPDLPIQAEARWKIASESIDGVFMLGKGFMTFDNLEISLGMDLREKCPHLKWIGGDTDRGSLLMLFTCLMVAVSGADPYRLNPLPYLRDRSLGKVRFCD